MNFASKMEKIFQVLVSSRMSAAQKIDWYNVDDINSLWRRMSPKKWLASELESRRK